MRNPLLACCWAEKRCFLFSWFISERSWRCHPTSFCCSVSVCWCAPRSFEQQHGCGGPETPWRLPRNAWLANETQACLHTRVPRCSATWWSSFSDFHMSMTPVSISISIPIALPILILNPSPDSTWADDDSARGAAGHTLRCESGFGW